MRAHILSASAGSGKTYRLAYKFVHDTIKHFQAKPYLYRAILAVTFTNKATEEMKSRILSEIHILASGAKSNYMDSLVEELGFSERVIRERAMRVRQFILHDYSRFTVLTIDTFFQRILRAFIKELGIDLNYNIELETATILTKSADSLIEEITTNRDLLGWLTRFVEERIEEVYAVLEAGTERARRKASETLHDVRNAMRINYFADKELISEQAERYRNQIDN